MEILWRRIVFNVLISNTDDHLRNHAFLYEGQNGWRLSPAYDLNPVPTDIKARVLTTAIVEDDTKASLDLAFKVAGYFEITDERARAVVKESWRPRPTGALKQCNKGSAVRRSTAWPRPSSMKTWNARARCRLAHPVPCRARTRAGPRRGREWLSPSSLALGGSLRVPADSPHLSRAR